MASLPQLRGFDLKGPTQISANNLRTQSEITILRAFPSRTTVQWTSVCPLQKHLNQRSRQTALIARALRIVTSDLGLIDLLRVGFALRTRLGGGGRRSSPARSPVESDQGSLISFIGRICSA